MELHIECGFFNDVIETDTWKITRMKWNISPAVIRDSEFVHSIRVEIKTSVRVPGSGAEGAKEMLGK